MRYLLGALLAAQLMSLGAYSHAKSYVWMDNKGVEHITNTPPPEEYSGLERADFSANILVVDSTSTIAEWVLLPDRDRKDRGRIRKVVVDKKYFLPFIVTGYQAVASDIRLTASVKVIAPNRKVLLKRERIALANYQEPRNPKVFVLQPVMNLQFDSNDAAGTYRILVSITDHVRSTIAKAEEKIELVK